MIISTTVPPTEADVLRAAAQALEEQEALQQAQRALDDRLRSIARQFDAATGSRGTSTDGLRRMCRMGGLL
jgi:hypothetical protein